MKFDILEVERVDSSNSCALKLLQNSNPSEGTVIWAREQYAGKGQGENQWLSEKGKSLTFSIILHPSFLSPESQFMLNKAVSLSVVNTVRRLLNDNVTRIKWPNDIYTGTGKVAGILIEHNILSNTIQHTIIGIGINLNQERFPAWIPDPVSLKQITGINFDAREVLDRYFDNLVCEYSRLRKGEFASTDADYTACLYGYGQEMEFTAGQCKFTGRISGVDAYGRLCVMLPDGIVRTFNHGEIRQNSQVAK
jgi:BirA family biotin operon repressor/biotin-[acetyl-CoA-carboxylase] ligase